jgi:hypothetical protein
VPHGAVEQMIFKRHLNGLAINAVNSNVLNRFAGDFAMRITPSAAAVGMKRQDLPISTARSRARETAAGAVRQADKQRVFAAVEHRCAFRLGRRSTGSAAGGMIGIGHGGSLREANGE